MPTIYKGDDETLAFTVEDEAGAAVDITATTIKYAIARSPAHEPALTKTTSDATLTIVDGSNGRFDVELTASDTSSLAPRQYYHEVEIEDDNGTVSTVYADADLTIVEDGIDN